MTRLIAAAVCCLVLTACGRPQSYGTANYAAPRTPAQLIEERHLACPDAIYEEQLFRQTGHLCPEHERLDREAAENHLKYEEASTRLAQILYDSQVKAYGRRAVLECRSRMTPEAPTYFYCLEVNRGR